MTFRDYKLNDLGQVVGNLASPSQAALWKNGTTVGLGKPAASSFSLGYAVNDAGFVAGRSDNVNFEFQSFVALYESGQWLVTDFPSGGYLFTSPSGINNNGVAVGFASAEAGLAYGRAFYLPQGVDTPILLNNESGNISSAALAINDNGLIAGVSFTDPNSTTAIIWTTNGNGQVLTPIGNANAQAINNNNIAVGYSGSTAVYWDVSGPHAITAGVANAINIGNCIVGNTIQANTPSGSLAWIKSPLYSDVYSLTALQSSPSITLYTASDVNSNLQIVGQSNLGGYIATPVVYWNLSGSGTWSSPGNWIWGFQPGPMHPVVISNPGTDVLVVTGPSSPSIVAELTVGSFGDVGLSALVISAGQSLTITNNQWGNGVTTISPTGVVIDNQQLNSSVSVQGVLAGTGVVNGSVSVTSGGALSLGYSLGTLVVNGNVALDASSSLNINITGTIPGVLYSQLDVSGTVNLGNAALSISGSNITAAGESFLILNNTGTSAISGIFNDLPEGAIITNFLGSIFDATISYVGGDGNDVEITTMASTNALLWSLQTGTGTLNPVFASNTFNYAFTVPNTTISISVTPTALDSRSTIAVNGSTVMSGSASADIPLAVGTNAIAIIVTAQDGISTETYTIIVTRAPVIAPPVLNPLSNYVVNAGVPINFLATATSSNANAVLIFSLVAPPYNAAISPHGEFNWRPTVAESGTTNVITVVVTDDAGQNLSSSNTFTVTVNPLGPVFLYPIDAAKGTFSMNVTGPNGPDYIVQMLTNIAGNIADWVGVQTIQSPITPFTFTDFNTNSYNYVTRLYRIKLSP